MSDEVRVKPDRRGRERAPESPDPGDELRERPGERRIALRAAHREAIIKAYQEFLGRTPSAPEVDSYMDDPFAVRHIEVSDEAKAYAERRARTLPVVKPSGHVFTADSEPWTWAGVSAFRLLDMILRDKDPLPFVRDWRSAGANVLRVFGMLDWPDVKFGPKDPMYFEAMRELFRLAAAERMYVEFVVFCDAQRIMPKVSDQIDHYVRVVQTVRDFPHVFLEIANEPWINGCDPTRVYLPHKSIVQSYGCWRYNADASYALNFECAEYLTLHTLRDSQWPRKAKDAYEFAEAGFPITSNKQEVGKFAPLRVPVVLDEPKGYADIPRETGSRSPVISDFEAYAAVSALLGAGGTFHYDGGLYDRRAREKELVAGVKFFEALHAIPGFVRYWQYTAGHHRSCPLQHSDDTALRTFGRVANDRAYCVVVRPTKEYKPTPAPGWEIVTKTGLVYALRRRA
jgi:hypothetical protein